MYVPIPICGYIHNNFIFIGAIPTEKSSFVSQISPLASKWMGCVGRFYIVLPSIAGAAFGHKLPLGSQIFGRFNQYSATIRTKHAQKHFVFTNERRLAHDSVSSLDRDWVRVSPCVADHKPN